MLQSNNEEDLSETELQDEDSGEDVLRIPVEAQNTPEQDVLAKLKQVLFEYPHSLKVRIPSFLSSLFTNHQSLLKF